MQRDIKFVHKIVTVSLDDNESVELYFSLGNNTHLIVLFKYKNKIAVVIKRNDLVSV